MKSVANPKAVADEYPCIKKHDATGLIVLFSERSKGIVVVGDSQFETVGVYAEDWYMPTFKKFHGSVTIEN